MPTFLLAYTFVLELSELGKQKQHDIYLLKFYLEQFRANNLVVILLFLLFFMCL
jgi:hypothetical protein